MKNYYLHLKKKRKVMKILIFSLKNKRKLKK